MKINVQLHASAVIPPFPIEQKTGWAAALSSLGSKEKSPWSCQESNSGRQFVRSQAHHRLGAASYIVNRIILPIWYSLKACHTKKYLFISGPQVQLYSVHLLAPPFPIWASTDGLPWKLTWKTLLTKTYTDNKLNKIKIPPLWVIP